MARTSPVMRPTRPGRRKRRSRSLLPGIRQRLSEVRRAIERQVEWVVLEPVRDVVDGAGDGVDELVVLGEDGRRDDRDQPRNDEEPCQKSKGGRRPLEPRPAQIAGDRGKRRAIVSATMIGRTMTFRYQSTVSSRTAAAAHASNRHDHAAPVQVGGNRRNLHGPIMTRLGRGRALQEKPAAATRCRRCGDSLVTGSRGGRRHRDRSTCRSRRGSPTRCSAIRRTPARS